MATVLLAALALASPASPATRAHLRVLARDPLTVVGSGFHPNERVTVTAIVGGKHVAKVRASTSGRFRVRFRHVRAKRCLSYVISARGALASLAILSVRSACAPP